MHSKLRKVCLAVAGGALAVAGMTMVGGGAGVAGAETVRGGNLIMTMDGRVTPARLPARGMAPAALSVSGSISDVNGNTPQPMQLMVLDFDRAGTLFTGGLPACAPARIENTTTEDAFRACRSALVGRGRANAIVEFPDQAPFDAPAPLLIFNAPGNNLVVHAYAFVPVPTTFVVPIRNSRAPQRQFGIRSTIRVPAIAGGNGSMTMFTSRLARQWNFRGKRRSVIYAGCPRGVHRAQGMFRFRGGPTINASVARRCIPRR